MQSISILQENQLSQRQHPHLLVNLAMKQAFHVLQLPILELAEWMKTEIESNPILEVDLAKETFKESLEEPEKTSYSYRNRSQETFEKRRKDHQESLLTAPISLYEHLMQQAPLIFENRQDLNSAELIIGHLNSKGYLDVPLQEIVPSVPLAELQRILQVVQSLDPPGVGACDLQECLLLQLKLKGKAKGIAAKIITTHFDTLLQNRLPQISQALRISMRELMHIIEKEIAPLDLYPGYRYCFQPTVGIIPDLHFVVVEGKWQIEINTAFLPRIKIAPVYLQALRENTLENQEYCYLKRQLAGGKWLKRIVQRRHQTLRSIGEFLLKRQLPFFNAEQAGLIPLTLQDAARELGLNESTIARAIANKYVACPGGVYALKTFFSQGMPTQEGQEISTRSLREILARTIEKEDKQKPLSDEQLAQHFKKIGIPCARRTIAKYRSRLNISPASKRKKWAK